MRVLWFVNSTSNYGVTKSKYNGGGWISSLETELASRKDLTLAVSFFLRSQPAKVTSPSGVTYYPLSPPHGKWGTLCRDLTGNPAARERRSWAWYQRLFLSVVKDFKPDVIHVFGSEHEFGLVAAVTPVPVVLHIQGLIIPYSNVFLPPFASWGWYVWGSLRPLTCLRRLRERRLWIRAALREREILRQVNHYIGRTEWDKSVISLYNPQATYHYGPEMLRPVFYLPAARTVPVSLTIVTTISNPPYKGFDLVLKTAALLKRVMGLGFDWYCFGNINPKPMERLTRIRHKDVNVILPGVVTAERLRKALLSATLYVHTSYIENGCLSVNEAQISGLPVIAVHAGGLDTMVNDGVTGLLVPANDPFRLAYLIADLYNNPAKAEALGASAREEALKRHDKASVVSILMDTYHTLLQ